MPKKRKLTEKEKLFVKEYLVDLNATQAAIRAGYSPKTAYSIGWENLKKPEIQERIQEEIKKRSKKVEVSVEYVLAHLMELVARCMQKKPVMEFDYENRELVQKVDEEGNHVWEFDSRGANTALKSLGEYLGMFKKVLAGDPDNPLFEPIKIVRAEKKNVSPKNVSKSP